MSDEASDLWSQVDATESRFEPELAWPPPPVEPTEPSLELEVGSFFGQKRLAMRRGLVFGLTTTILSIATAALASDGLFQIAREPAPRLQSVVAPAKAGSGSTATASATSSGAVAWPLATSARKASVAPTSQPK
jgi:hypothetical protein